MITKIIKRVRNSFTRHQNKTVNKTIDREAVDKRIRELMATQLEEHVYQFLAKNDEIMVKLEELLENLQKHSTDCNIAKTVGTSVSAVGSLGAVAALGMAFAPITAGLSSVVTIGAGVTAGLGSLTTIGTVIADSIICKKFIEEIIGLAEQKNQCDSDLMDRFTELSNFFNGDYDHIIYSGDDNFAVLKSLLRGGQEIYYLGKNQVSLVESIRELNAARNTGNVGNNSVKLLKSVRELNVANTAKNGKNVFTGLVKNVRNIVTPTEKAGIDLFVKTTGPTVGKALFKSATVLAGVAFTVVDVIALVNDWKKNRPTIELIQKLIGQLKKERNFVIFHYYKLISPVDKFNDMIDCADSFEQLCHVLIQIFTFLYIFECIARSFVAN